MEQIGEELKEFKMKISNIEVELEETKKNGGGVIARGGMNSERSGFGRKTMNGKNEIICQEIANIWNFVVKFADEHSQDKIYIL